MATEIIRPAGLVDNTPSRAEGWSVNANGLPSLWSDVNIATGAAGDPAAENGCQVYLTLENTSVLNSADTINSVQLFVYASPTKVSSSTVTLALKTAPGAPPGLFLASTITTVSGAAYYGFTDSGYPWTKSIIDEMTMAILPTIGIINIYEAYVAIDYTVTTVSVPIKLTSGLIQLTSGKISI